MSSHQLAAVRTTVSGDYVGPYNDYYPVTPIDPLPRQPAYPSCGCPWCRQHYIPTWPCGRPRRYWDTPIPDVVYFTAGDQSHINHGAMSGTGQTSLCN